LASHTKGKTQIEVFENGVLRRIFGPERKEVPEKTAQRRAL
jgi:hypothetical protein